MRRLPLIASVLASLMVTASPMVRAEGLTDMTPDERAAFNDAVRAYLLENPEVIVEAMTELQNREMVAAAERDKTLLAQNAELIYNSASDWSGGNLSGDVVLVEFMDYRCGYCHKAYNDVNSLVSGDGNIRFVLKEFPILGEQSLLASKFAIAVLQLHGADAYKAAHDALFAFRGDFTPETLARLAKDLGHDADAVAAKMADPSVQAVIDANYALANQFEIGGTPTFILDGTLVQGYVPLAEMQKMVAEARNDG